MGREVALVSRQTQRLHEKQHKTRKEKLPYSLDKKP